MKTKISAHIKMLFCGLALPARNVATQPLYRRIRRAQEWMKVAATAAFFLSSCIVLTLALRPEPATRPPKDPVALKAAYAQVPLAFEVNAGQTDAQVQYLARGSGYTIFLTAADAVLKLQDSEGNRAALRLRLEGANQQAQAEGTGRFPGTTNYFIGSDPSKWRTNVPLFSQVRYPGVYPGVDLVYRGNQRQLQFDFIVAPGADPRAIALNFEEAERIDISAEGDLVLRVAAKEVRFRKPFVYQETDGVRHEVAARYLLTRELRAGFEVAAYDRSKALVIDPTIVYATYFGGISADLGQAVAVDAAGAAYLTGITSSTDFPTTPGAFQEALAPDVSDDGCEHNGADAYVAKIDPSQPGAAGLIYSTYLGGSCTDSGLGIAVDAAGNAYVTGQTLSQNFPVTPTAYQGSTSVFVFRGDAFLAKLNPAGNGLLYSTYLGADDADYGAGVAVDLLGMAYITGRAGPGFPTTPGAFESVNDQYDAFVAKFDTTQAGVLSLVYSTYLGGSFLTEEEVCCGEDTAFAIAVDPDGNAYVTGFTDSVDFPTTANAAQPSIASLGGRDAFVSKLNASGSALLYSTYLGGGTSADEGRGIAIDAAGNAYVTGITGPGFPTTPGALQSTHQGAGDAFVTKVDTVTGPLVYSTYLGGGARDEGRAIAVNSSGNAFVTGTSDFIIGFPGYTGSGSEVAPVFVTKMNTTGTAVEYSEFIGGRQGNGIALNLAGEVYVVGWAHDDSGVPTTPDAFQTSQTGGGDAFLVKFGPAKVVTNTNDSGPNSLRQALADAEDGDTIIFNIPTTDPGYSAGVWTINLTTGELVVDKNVVINGLGADVLVVRPAAADFRIFHVSVVDKAAPGERAPTLIPPGVTIRGMTISDGAVSNVGDRGGAIYNNHTALTLNNCVLRANVATYGGAIYNDGADTGGASLTITNSVLFDALGFFNGGGIYNDGTGGNAGVTITNTTFFNCGAFIGGGAIYNSGNSGIASVIMTSCTLSGNADGIFNQDGSVTLGNTIITDSVFAGNIINSGSGTVTSSGYNLSDDDGAGFLIGTGDQINTDPILGPLKDNGGPTFTHAPLSNSPAIDMGKDIGATGQDQRGGVRPITYDASIIPPVGGDRSDIGAVELAVGVQPTSAVSEKLHGAAGPFPLSLALTGAPGIECRSGGKNNDYQVILTFAQPVTFSSATLHNGTGFVSGSSGSGTTTVTLSVTGVTSQQIITLALFDTDDGTNSGDVGLRMGVLVGDTTGNGDVTASDVSDVKLKSGEAVMESNFRADVTANGAITSTDVSLVKSKSGMALP